MAYSRIGINGTTVDVEKLFCQYLGTFVDRSPRAIEYTTQHVLRDTELQALSSEFDFCLVPRSATYALNAYICLTFFTSIPEVPSKT